MSVIRIILISVVTVMLFGCANNNDKWHHTGKALPGTDTAVVSISLDDKGVPVDGVEKLELHPGQRVIYAGPSEFVIFFKNKKSPVKDVERRSNDGVVIIEIPTDIFEKPEFVEEFRRNKFLRFDYGIRVNGKELDPPMVITTRF